MDQTKYKAACVLLEDTRRGLYLGVTRKDNHNDWGLPGGKIESGEDPVTCAIRELYEETGLVVKESLTIDTIHPLDYVVLDGHEDVVTIVLSNEDIVDIDSIRTDEKGLVGWVSQDNLFKGTFGEYNYQLVNRIEKNRSFIEKAKDLLSTAKLTGTYSPFYELVLKKIWGYTETEDRDHELLSIVKAIVNLEPDNKYVILSVYTDFGNYAYYTQKDFLLDYEQELRSKRLLTKNEMVQ
jgi:8-oxo-dGTP pyrophosphatase MutT (NUDIX family)